MVETILHDTIDTIDTIQSHSYVRSNIFAVLCNPGQDDTKSESMVGRIAYVESCDDWCIV